MGIIFGRDKDKSNGVNSGSVDAELSVEMSQLWGIRRTVLTNLIRTKSCIMNLYTALVGCVMYTFPFPSLKFVCVMDMESICDYNNSRACLFHNIRERCSMVNMEAVINVF